MELLYECTKTGLRAVSIRGLGPERDCAERELLAAGVPVALPHRAVWALHLSPWEQWFLLLRDASGRACAGLAIEVVRTRAMPGHVILRVGRFGANLPEDTCFVALQALTIMARKIPRVLRLQLNLFSPDRRQALCERLAELGFREICPPSSYRYTLAIDLSPTEDQIFANFGRSARKRIREMMKPPLQSVVITHAMYARRLKELQMEAFSRTAGHRPTEDWGKILKMSEACPNLSRVIGIFVDQDLDPQRMIAFNWACNHGDSVECRASASTRKIDVRMPSGYRMIWDQVCWSKAMGAQWFDMGGVTMGGKEESSLEGISDFKRHFSQEILEVGAEWVFEPHPVWSGIAMSVSNAAQSIRGWMETSH